MLVKRMRGLATTILLAIVTAGFGVMFSPISALAQDAGQSTTGNSVADAARKARDNKKNAPKGTRVYTDDDVRPAPAPGTSSQSATEPPAAAASGATPGDPQAAPANTTGEAVDTKNTQAGTAPAGKDDEKAWRERFKVQHDQLARAEKELDVLQREEVKAQVQYYPDPQKALTEGYTRKDINDKDTKIAAKKDEIAKIKQGLDDLEDQLRKAGGDPGWAR
jgi:hypothetical protein